LTWFQFAIVAVAVIFLYQFSTLIEVLEGMNPKLQALVDASNRLSTSAQNLTTVTSGVGQSVTDELARVNATIAGGANGIDPNALDAPTSQVSGAADAIDAAINALQAAKAQLDGEDVSGS
jgi:hypothetical protein